MPVSAYFWECEPSPVQLGPGGSPPRDRGRLCKGVLFLRGPPGQVLGLCRRSVHRILFGGGRQQDVDHDRRVRHLGPPAIQCGKVRVAFHVVPRWQKSGPPDRVQTWRAGHSCHEVGGSLQALGCSDWTRPRRLFGRTSG